MAQAAPSRWTFGKKYETNEEMTKRQAVYEANLDLIKKQNDDFNAGRANFTMGVNQVCGYVSRPTTDTR